MYLTEQKVKPSVKEFIDKLKPGQMIQLISEYSFREGESYLSKGLFVEINSNSRLIFIPAYTEDPYYNIYKRTMGIDLKQIDEIKKTRFPKEISDNLRVVHKEYNYYHKLQKQQEEIKQQMSLIYQSMELKHSNIIREYVSSANDVRPDLLISDMLKDLQQSFEQRNKNALFGVYFSNGESQEGFHIIQIDFSGNTGRGVFSKESFDSRLQYENSDYNKLIERYCPKVNENGFKNKDWNVKVKKSVGLGDKGSLEVESIVELTLNKKKFSNAYMETLREEIYKAVCKSI